MSTKRDRLKEATAKVDSIARRRRIEVVAGELTGTVHAGIAALKAAKVPMFDRGGMLVRPVHVEKAELDGHVRRQAGSTVLRPVDPGWLRLRLTELATWVKFTAKGEPRFINPPMDVATLIATVTDEGAWPPLRAIVRHPLLTLDGRWVGTPGYHDGVLLDIVGDWLEPACSRSDAEAAVATLRAHVRHFPFASPVDEAVAMSLLITSVMRAVIDAAPLHGADAPAAGTGKSLLIDVAAILATGIRAPVMDYGRDPNEAAKRLDAMLLAGDSVICIDNIEAPLEGAALCQTLTQPARRIRPLGASVMTTVPTSALICATGNNLVLRGDICRRALIARLDAGVERPELRAFDQDILVETIERRVELVHACQTIVAAYLRAESASVGPLGSFEAWSRSVRAALVWLGVADPAQAMERTREADPKRESLLAVLTAWHAAFGADPTTVADAIAIAEHNPSLREALAAVGARRGELDAAALGRWLRNNRDARIGRMALRRNEGRAGTARWSVCGGDGGDGGDVLAPRAREIHQIKGPATGTSPPIPTIPTNGVCRRCAGEGCPYCEGRP